MIQNSGEESGRDNMLVGDDFSYLVSLKLNPE
jgi:hypothetical protein